MAALEHAVLETKEVLQPLFPKPKLSLKLLSKPPFRFIHDIIVATLKSTGFPNGFFTLEELDSSNFKDKTTKVSFLNKLIHLASVGNGSALVVSPAKVVSGQEPVNTNILLTTFGRLAKDETFDRDGLIQHCLSGKGIDEFRNKSSTSLADVSNAHGEVSRPSVEDVPNGNTPVVANKHPIMEQIKACNEDVEQTRVMISELISKPKCSDKLLSKPPFRFIHDLIMAIGKATEFDLLQMFSNDELASSNVKEKNAKLAFLSSFINFLEKSLEMSINVKPAKIISGLEPERTRYLLQIFTVVATTKCLAATESVDQPEPPKSETRHEEAKDSTEMVREDEQEHDLPAEESRKSFDNVECILADADAEVENQVSKEDASAEPTLSNPSGSLAPTPSVERPETAHGGKEDASADPSVERPETAHGGRPSPLTSEEEKGEIEAIDVIDVIRPTTTAMVNLEDRGERESAAPASAVVQSLYTSEPAEETKANDPSIPMKIVLAQRLNATLVEEEEMKMIDYDDSVRTRASKITLPPLMSNHDFEALAEEIKSIAQSTVPLGKYINSVGSDMEVMMRERNHWIGEREGASRHTKTNCTHQGEYLAPLQAKLGLLTDEVQNQVTVIKRLEEHVKRNDKVLKQQGVTHAY